MKKILTISLCCLLTTHMLIPLIGVSAHVEENLNKSQISKSSITN